MKQVDTKKLVLGCLVIMILMIVYTKIDQGGFFPKKEAEVKIEKNVEKKSNSLLTGDTLLGFADPAALETEKSADAEEDSAEDEDEGILGPAEPMDLAKARKESYGLVAELDHVSKTKISFHGNFGYMIYSLEEKTDGSVAASLSRAVTLEELGGLTMGGAAYTDLVGGDGCALIVPGIHNQEIARRRKFLYIEETNEITGGIVAPAWMMEKMANNDYSDSVVEEAYMKELTAMAKEQFQSKLLYGPVLVSAEDSDTYGFLAAAGEKLEHLWYGIWDREAGTVTEVRLFE